MLCLMHQCQKAVEKSLKLADSFLAKMNHSSKYFASMAKVTNLWRENITKIFRAWAECHSAVAAVEFGKRFRRGAPGG
eukprot:12621939-Alexandrium_andersonii.AAC.1